jgi:hypothetical protein
MDFDTVRTLALTFPGVEESTMYGATAFKLRGKLLSCTPTNKSAEPDSFAVRIGIDDRAELIETAPETYYVTDHYAPYPMVLVRLSRIDPAALKDLLGMAYRFVDSAKPLSKSRRRRAKPTRAKPTA